MDSQEAYSQYQKTLEKTRTILNYQNDLIRMFGNKGFESLKLALEKISSSMERAAQNDGLAEIQIEDKNLVTGVVKSFLNIAIEKPITPIFRDLADNYLMIVYNWSQMLAKCSGIEQDIKVINGIVRSQLTLLDTISVLKVILERAKNIRNYDPPAFDLSRAYLDNLKSAIEERDPKSNNNENKCG